MQQPITSRAFKLSDIKTVGNKLPARIIYHAVEGFGKTSFAAAFPDPIFIQARGETGLETLIDAKQLPETPHFPECQTWMEILSAVNLLKTEEHNHKTLILDTINGTERLCLEAVCNRDYAGDWSDSGFMSYHKGFETAMRDWAGFLSRLDDLRNTKQMRIICLCHSKIKNFGNPEGVSYDRFEGDMNAKLWGLLKKWSDMILFGNYHTVVEGGDAKKKGTGKGGAQRFMYTQHTAAFDAKNRHGLPRKIDLGNSYQESYTNFLNAMKEGAKKGQGK